VSIGSIIKSVSARFADAFWRGFDEARAESVARAQPARSAAQPAPPDADHPFLASAEFKTALATIIKDAFSDGVAAERKRIAEVLQAPGVASYPLLAFELAIDGASVAQVSAVIARTEVAVQARVHPTEAAPPESSTPTIH
jgi:hypothetical protein